MKSTAVLSLLVCAVVVSAIRIPIKHDDSTFQVKDDQDLLKQLASRIIAAQGLNATVLGDNNAWSYLWTGIMANSTQSHNLGLNVTFPLDGITFNIIDANGQYELKVQATANIWGHASTPVQLTFMYASGALDVSLVFGISSWVSLPPKITPKNNWYSGVSFVGDNNIAIATSTFTDLDNTSYKRGVTITAAVDGSKLPIAGQLLHMMGNSNSNLGGTIVAYFPLSTSDALAYFTLTFTGTINFFSTAVQAKALQLQVVADNSPSATLTTTVLVNLTNQTLDFSVNADASVSSGIDFHGTLQNSPWKHAFGLSWFTLDNLDLQFQIPPNGAFTGQLTMGGDAALTYQNQPPVHVTFDLSVGSTGVDGVLTLQTSIAGVDAMFDDILGFAPTGSDQVKTTGQVTLALATSNSGQYQQGLTITGTAVVGGTGDLASTVSALSAYSQRTVTWNFFFYSNVFSTTPQNIDFKLSETGGLQITDNAVLNNMQFEFSKQPNAQATLAAQLAVTFDHETTPQLFDVQTTANAQQLTFHGEMEGTWNHPFGLNWLQLSQITVDMAWSVPQQKLTTFNVNANYNISIALSTDPTLVINFQGNFHQYTFQLDVYISNAKSFFDAVLPTSTAPELTNEMSMSASLTISNQPSGNVVDGITVQAQVMILPTGKIATAIRSLSPGAKLEFDTVIAVPIWGSGTLQCQFDFQQTGTNQLSSNVQLNGFDLHVEIAPNPEVSLKSNAAVTFNHNNGNVNFALTADLSASQFSMSGNLVGSWDQAFGLKWLNINNMQISLGFSGFHLTTVSLAGSVTASFSVHGQQAKVTVGTSADFQDVVLQISDMGVVNFRSAVDAITSGNTPSEFGDINSADNSLTFTIATYAGSVNGQNFVKGISIVDHLVISGTTLQRMKVFNRNNANTLTFDASLIIPNFDTVPDLSLSLSTDIPVPINQHATFDSITFSLSFAPLVISVSTLFSVTYTNNPTLQFDISGSLAADGTVAFEGRMNGQWNNLFGFADLSANNVDLDIGFNPAMCAADLCISQFGMGFNISLGSITIAFDGFVNVPEIQHIFIHAAVDGANGMALSFRDVADGYNDIAGTLLPHLNPQDFPDDWGLKNLDFYLAPESGTFDGIQYTAGFYMDGGFRFLGVDCEVNVSIMNHDFNFHVGFSVDLFNEMVQHSLLAGLHDSRQNFTGWSDEAVAAYLTGSNVMPGTAGGAIVKVTAVSLGDVSCQAMAQSQYPPFSMEYTLLGGHHHANFGVDLFALYKDFDYFWKKYLESLFH